MMRRFSIGVLLLASATSLLGEDKDVKSATLNLLKLDADKAEKVVPAKAPVPPKPLVSPANVPGVFAAGADLSPAASNPDAKSADSHPKANASEEVVHLPEAVVTVPKLGTLKHDLDLESEAMEAEEKQTKATTLDDVLNKYSFLGPAGSRERASEARQSVDMIIVEKKLLVAIDQSTSEAEKKELRELLEEVRTMRRLNVPVQEHASY